MAEPHALTLGFLEFHPRVAAEAMEDLDAADAAALLEHVPARICADLFSCAAPWASAVWIENLSAVHAAAILQNMLYQEATTALRLVGEQQREKVLEELPVTTARRFIRSLTYPSATVGAWMDPSVATFGEDESAANGLKFLKSRRRKPIPHLIVVGERKTFKGMVSATELLRSSPEALLGEIMDASVSPLSNRALLTSVVEDLAWDDYPSLPVVGRKGNVLGTLARSSLRRGVANTGTPAEDGSGDSLFVQLATGYFTAVAGLLRMLAASRQTQHRKTTTGGRT